MAGEFENGGEIVIPEEVMEKALKIYRQDGIDGVRKYINDLNKRILESVCERVPRKKVIVKKIGPLTDEAIKENIFRLREFMPGDRVKAYIPDFIKREGYKASEDGLYGTVVGYRVIYNDGTLFIQKELPVGSYIEPSQPIVKIDKGTLMTDTNFSYSLLQNGVADERSKGIVLKPTIVEKYMDNYVGNRVFKDNMIIFKGNEVEE